MDSLKSGFSIGYGIGPKISANLGFDIGIGPKPKVLKSLYSRLLNLFCFTKIKKRKMFLIPARFEICTDIVSNQRRVNMWAASLTVWVTDPT